MSERADERLAACPFCEGEPTYDFLRSPQTPLTGGHIACTGCGARTPMLQHEDVELLRSMLAARWNRRCALARIADLEAQLAEFDAAPATDSRIWDGVRDAIEARLAESVSGSVTGLANALTRIALGEREDS